MFNTRALRSILSLLATITLLTTASGENSDPSEQEVRNATDHFLRAFENLDMPGFMACFAPDATVFFPVPEPQTRFDGKDAIQRQFELVFAAIRHNSTRPSPPFHTLKPENLQVKLLGDRAAVVTFQLTHGNHLARRTILFEKRGDIWLIVHLHASNFGLNQQKPGQTTMPSHEPHS